MPSYESQSFTVQYTLMIIIILIITTSNNERPRDRRIRVSLSSSMFLALNSLATSRSRIRSSLSCAFWTFFTYTSYTMLLTDLWYNSVFIMLIDGWTGRNTTPPATLHLGRGIINTGFRLWLWQIRNPANFQKSSQVRLRPNF